MRDLLKALRRLKVETGSLACLGCGHEHNCATQGCAILRAAIEEIEAAPAVDAVEVCRCKDCRYGTIDQYSAGEYIVVCDAPKKLHEYYDIYALDWFCPLGQRREDGDGDG